MDVSWTHPEIQEGLHTSYCVWRSSELRMVWALVLRLGSWRFTDKDLLQGGENSGAPCPLHLLSGILMQGPPSPFPPAAEGQPAV